MNNLFVGPGTTLSGALTADHNLSLGGETLAGQPRLVSGVIDVGAYKYHPE